MDEYVPYDICSYITRLKETCLQFLECASTPTFFYVILFYGGYGNFSHSQLEKLYEMENLNNKKPDAASMCDTGALSRPTDAKSAADAEADSL